MKKCFFKIYKSVFLYKKNELKFLANKICFLKNKELLIKMRIKSYHKSFCFITGVKRSVYNFFNMARWNLKYSLSLLKVVGLKKVSW